MPDRRIPFLIFQCVVPSGSSVTPCAPEAAADGETFRRQCQSSAGREGRDKWRNVGGYRYNAAKKLLVGGSERIFQIRGSTNAFTEGCFGQEFLQWQRLRRGGERQKTEPHVEVCG